MAIKNFTNFKSVATLPCRTSVSENKRHSQTNVAVNAKSPGSVATDLKLVKFLIAVFFLQIYC